METKSNVPAIRFKWFDGEWVEKALGEVTRITMGQSPSGENYTDNPEDHVLVQGNADMKNGFVKPRIWTTQVTKTADVGDLIFSVRAPVGETGKTAYNLVIGRGVAAIKANEFIFQCLSKMNLNGYWKKLSAGSTFDSINSTDLSTALIQLAPNKEQTKIGNLFKQLDTLITQHQKKHDKLLNLKKAMLEKMFPKQGATVPEIRFKGFGGEWVEKVLGKITDSFSGGTPQVGNEEYYKGDIPFIRSGEINSNSTELFISDLGLKNSSARLVNVGCIFYALYGATSGEVGLSKINGAINQAVLAITPHSEISSGFVMQWLRKNKAQIISTYLQGGQGNLSGTIVKSLVVDLPHYKEQTKIGNIFKQLDTLLNQHQAQLKKLNNIKQACLEKMFV